MQITSVSTERPSSLAGPIPITTGSTLSWFASPFRSFESSQCSYLLRSSTTRPAIAAVRFTCATWAGMRQRRERSSAISSLRATLHQSTARLPISRWSSDWLRFVIHDSSLPLLGCHRSGVSLAVQLGCRRVRFDESGCWFPLRGGEDNLNKAGIHIGPDRAEFRDRGWRWPPYRRICTLWFRFWRKPHKHTAAEQHCDERSSVAPGRGTGHRSQVLTSDTHITPPTVPLGPHSHTDTHARAHTFHSTSTAYS